jgi:peptide/nickel transport system permease protein
MPELDVTPALGRVTAASSPDVNPPDLVRRRSGPSGFVAACTLFLGLVVAAALAAPLIVEPSATTATVAAPVMGPSSAHLLGTDEVGRDIAARLLYGARVSLTIALAASVFALVLGSPLGLVSGYRGGVVDTVIMRFADGLLAFPAIVLAMALVAALGASGGTLVVAIGLVNVPVFIRLVRGEVLALRNREFVTASRAVGARHSHIMLRTIAPNLQGVLMVQMTVVFASAILAEAALSFLGLGVQPPAPSWGGMLEVARRYLDRAPLFAVAPGLAIFAVVLSLSVIGDWLSDVYAKR